MTFMKLLSDACERSVLSIKALQNHKSSLLRIEYVYFPTSLTFNIFEYTMAFAPKCSIGTYLAFSRDFDEISAKGEN